MALWTRTLMPCCLGLCLMAAAGDISAGGKGGIKVKEGQKAPEIDLPATQIESVFKDRKDAKSLKLSDFKGKKHVVLFFYPKALTGG
ncbi:MAG: redoxin domain-containing protein [Planctomycetes bacterium]|nr:redoxin domain-containing protein [Planctomycetota bacterium]